LGLGLTKEAEVRSASTLMSVPSPWTPDLVQGAPSVGPEARFSFTCSTPTDVHHVPEITVLGDVFWLFPSPWSVVRWH